MTQKILFTFLFLFLCGCSLFDRRAELTTVSAAPAPVDEGKKRTTRKSIEEESMLGESSGSLWVTRGQQAYLFTNNNQRLLGDLINIKLDGYPKEQIQTKMNTISKLLAEILGEQKQEIEFKNTELKKKITLPEEEKPAAPAKPGAPTPVRGLASTELSEEEQLAQDEQNAEAEKIRKDIASNNKELKKIGDESEEIEQLKTAKDLPIKSLPTRIIDIQKDGNYKVRGEAPFMIGKREYKLLVMGTVRSEDFDEQGISAEKLVDPTFDVISEKKTEAL